MPAHPAQFGTSALSSVSGLPGLSGRTAGKAFGRLSTLFERVAHGRERVVLTRRGKSLAAMVPLEDMRLLEELEDRADLADARAALTENGDSRAWEDVREVLGL